MSAAGVLLVSGHMSLRTLGVIPARFAAQRFPGKPLALIAGRPLIEHVYRQAKAAHSLDDVIVATDDTRILEAVESFGGTAILTSPDCVSGTDRVAEAAQEVQCDYVVNIQGDEPLMRPEMIDQLVDGICSDRSCQMATLARVIESVDALDNPDIVKVVIGMDGRALYFSRSPIPYVRDAINPDARLQQGLGHFYKHLGIYAFQKAFLLEYVGLDQSPLEQTEKLEQLRALEHGVGIKVLITPHDSVGVDRPEDVVVVENILVMNQAKQEH